MQTVALRWTVIEILDGNIETVLGKRLWRSFWVGFNQSLLPTGYQNESHRALISIRNQIHLYFMGIYPDSRNALNKHLALTFYCSATAIPTIPKSVTLH